MMWSNVPASAGESCSLLIREELPCEAPRLSALLVPGAVVGRGASKLWPAKPLATAGVLSTLPASITVFGWGSNAASIVWPVEVDCRPSSALRRIVLFSVGFSLLGPPQRGRGALAIASSFLILSDQSLGELTANLSSHPIKLDFQTITIWSAPPEAKKLPFSENFAVKAGPVWPCSVYNRRPSLRSHILMDASLEVESR